MIAVIFYWLLFGLFVLILADHVLARRSKEDSLIDEVSFALTAFIYRVRKLWR